MKLDANMRGFKKFRQGGLALIIILAVELSNSGWGERGGNKSIPWKSQLSIELKAGHH